MRAAKGLGAGAGSTRGAARMARAWAGARSRQRAPGLWRLWLGPRGQRAGPTCQGGVRAHVVGGAHVPGRGPRAGAGPSSGVGAGGRVPCFSLFLRRGLMASWSADSEAGASRLPVFRGSSPPTTAPGLLLAFSGVPDSGCSPPSVPAGSMDAAPGRAPPGAGGPGSGLPRNVLSERERRKRISVSCERLRALLPQFEGRREDMASVLEMAVRFLQLARGLAPAWEQPGLHASRKDAWAGWPQSLLQLALAGQVPAEEPGGTTPQELLGCAVLGVEESKAAAGSSGLLDRLSPVPGERWPGPRPSGQELGISGVEGGLRPRGSQAGVQGGREDLPSACCFRLLPPAACPGGRRVELAAALTLWAPQAASPQPLGRDTGRPCCSCPSLARSRSVPLSALLVFPSGTGRGPLPRAGLCSRCPLRLSSGWSVGAARRPPPQHPHGRTPVLTAGGG
ncbi:spermatogenesis- and oogenesis-specific basic helix-loop-helix-containing protein 1 isoform X1 [Oryctolagus cuniculus]|uniref:spermatogenesis- and oogenesis-specific basic helix-loop-helix-containing protein 1 isoform X1 n=1 Tax=Oryctolagus cuniculus TaxID=9986 RepID=UPI003879B4E8